MSYDFEADALLLRGVLSTAAHDLGGLSSALALRTDAMAGALAPSDVVALRAMSSEARALGRQLRKLRGAGGGTMLAPAGERALATWIVLIERFGRPLLGTGVILEASADEGTLEEEAERAVTFAVLALCSAVRETRGEQSVAVELRAAGADGTLDVSVRVRWSKDRPPTFAESRWYLHARSLVTLAGLQWEDAGNSNVRIRRPSRGPTPEASDKNTPSG